LAITDHDTTSGWDEASRAVGALNVPFTLIRGTEFSCVHQDERSGRTGLHLLGYLFDPLARPLQDERTKLRLSRFGRGEAIVANLVEAGYPISWQQVVDIADGGTVGRPHIGQALIESGVVSSVTEAFSEILCSTSPHYVRKQDMPVLDAISMILQAGGVSVLAHPRARRRGKILDEASLETLAEAGLAGIEVDHMDHAAEDRDALREIASGLGLLTTGSSDYHGTRKSVRLGAETTSPEVLEQIIARASGIDPISSPREK
jgi:predicted metal-dependent phosphoesterase TrpH